jgi:hypothetical protein
MSPKRGRVTAILLENYIKSVDKGLLFVWLFKPSKRVFSSGKSVYSPSL